MKKQYLSLIFLLTVLALFSCRKDEDGTDDLLRAKNTQMTGRWKQKDIVLGVPIKVGNLSLPAGTSLIREPVNSFLAAMLGGANPFFPTKDNSYTFATDASYGLDGIASPVLPDVGTSGRWQLEIHGAVLAFYPKAADERVPHWINTLSTTQVSFALTAKMPGLGDIPVNLLLDKEE